MVDTIIKTVCALNQNDSLRFKKLTILVRLKRQLLFHKESISLQLNTYYITIVTAYRKRLFGEIVNGEMVLNDWGRITYDEFFKSFEMRAELFLGEFVLMPDHLHAIVIMDKTKCMDDGLYGDVSHGPVETHGRASLQHGRAPLVWWFVPLPIKMPAPIIPRTIKPLSLHR